MRAFYNTLIEHSCNKIFIIISYILEHNISKMENMRIIMEMAFWTILSINTLGLVTNMYILTFQHQGQILFLQHNC